MPNSEIRATLEGLSKIVGEIALNQNRIVGLLARQLPGLTDGDREALLRGTRTTLPRIQMLQRQIAELGGATTENL